ncbi:unnamed protein product [Darwinula stevensoni]|uniref:Tyrosine aminotransferase n=1 Tax=Darwinula stevensoni TaxID=69355 RepID=A0A7R9A6K8_9CRUS|nr:unnamed protein product [Darwinula stevensoni]CAG0888146.1 unnamed protein product [Darwinula stevensoni]
MFRFAVAGKNQFSIRDRRGTEATDRPCIEKPLWFLYRQARGSLKTEPLKRGVENYLVVQRGLCSREDSSDRRSHSIIMRLDDPSSWFVPASIFAKRTFNPIRDVVETLDLRPNPDKPMIALSIGDPTVFGNLGPCQEIIEAVLESVRSGSFNGYAPSTGYLEARRAVADKFSLPNAELEAKDVILASGCSCALDLCITVLANPGQNILFPKPGFAIYRTLAEGLGINTKQYNLIPDRNWEVDLPHLESLIDHETAAIVVNNPSNPCGSVYKKSHLQDILSIAARHKLPILADEIYDDFVFEGEEFHRLASLTTEVPILSCGGLTKKYLVPGWRMGWILIYDRQGIFDKEVRKGLQCLSQRIIGSNTLIQGALPAIFKNTPPSFFASSIQQVQDNAVLAFEHLSKIPGLTPVAPQGAMYMMVKIDMENFPEFSNEMEFVERLVSEQSVFCLPGKCFDYPNYIRIVLTVPRDQMVEALRRTEAFCLAHHVPASPKKPLPAVDVLASFTSLLKSNGSIIVEDSLSIQTK